MDIDRLAQALFGSPRAETQEVSTDGTTRTYMGVAMSDSDGGTVVVDLGGDVTLPDDLYDEDGNVVAEWDGVGVEMSTSPQVLEGEDVIVTLVGGSATKKPMVTAVAGTGDRQNERINAIEADYVKATELEADVADIGFLKADSATITALQADTAKVHDLTAAQLTAATGYVGDLQAGSVSAQDIVAGKATVGELVADHVSVSDLDAATARIGDLEADHVSVSDFQAEQANIDNLQAATADIDTIRANSAKVQNLTAAQLEADHATIGTLDTTYMHANMSNSDVAWIQNGTIKDGAITNAMINSVSANKLTAGTIDASNITVTNLNADNITTGTINGQRIGEGSLSLDKLSESVYTEAEVDNIVDGLNDRIDGAIETHTGTTVPTLNNAPASSWNTTALRDEHVGDVYYVVNSQSQQNGYCYRFTKSGSTYSWQLIKDSDVTAALSRLTTAEGKITSIESFDSTVSSLMTDTDDELTSIKSRASSLETRMTDAEDDISDKVDTSTFNTLSQTVDTNTASITSLSSTVSQKADGSTVTALTNRVSTVEQDVDGIETSIGELQDTVESKADGSTVSTISNRLNTVSDTVDGHTQTLTSVQNTLSTKADSSTVSTLSTQVNTIEDTVDGHTQTISGQSTILSNNGLTSSTNITNRVSSVEQDLNGYKTTVSETYTTKEEFENLEIGGRNLLAYSGTGKNWSYSTFVNGVYTRSTTATSESYVEGRTVAPLELGETYTFSAWMKTNGQVSSVDMFLYDHATKTVRSKGLGEITTEWAFYTLTVTMPDSWASGTNTVEGWHARFDNNGSKTSGTEAILYVREPKLEKGNKATDWTPAPEDVETRLSSAESSITQNAENIELKVSKDGVISSINQSAESVKIQASKVEIDGTAVFSAISSDVDDAITDKGYATTTQAQGYATTAKSEAISTAAADATSKANAAQTAATNAANTATDQKLTSYSTTQQMNEAIQDATGPLFYGKENSSGYIHLGHVPYAVGSSANYSHLHLTGRIGGWLSTTSGSIDVTFKSRTDNALYNTVDRRDETVDTSFVDVLVYTGTDGFTHYWIKVNSYWYAQLYAEFEQFVEDDHTLTATEPDGTCVWKLSEHAAVAAAKSSAVKRTQRIWYRKSASGAPATPGAASSNWVTKADDGNDAWTKMHIAISSTHKYIYTCEQYEMADGTVGYTSVLLDNTITVIDGGNIITGTVTANKLNASDINASKTLTVGAMTDAAAATILNSNISVGGRNLFVGSSTGANWSYSTFDPSGVVYTRSTTATTESFVQAPNMTFEAGETYTLSCWAKSNGNVTSMDMYKVHSSGGGSHQSSRNIPLTTEYQKITWTFVCNATSAEVAYIRFDNNGSKTSGTEAILYIKEPKLEVGNKATDWTPAPEDVDSAISDAAKTATSYVTDITGGGIMVHPSGDSTTGVQITDDVDILRDGTSVINIGTDDAIRIGAADNVQMLIESDGLEIDNEVGDKIFGIESSSSGSTTVTAALVTWSAVADVDTTARTVSDSTTAAGEPIVTATVNGTDYTLESTHVTSTVTAGTGVSVALTSDGVSYVQGLMVIEVDEDDVETIAPCELSVEYQRAVTNVATLDFVGRQVVRGSGIGRAMAIINDSWSSSNTTDTLIEANNTVTNAGVAFGVGASGQNRGIWDNRVLDWLICRNENNDTAINGTKFSVAASGNVKSTYQVRVTGNGTTADGQKRIALRSNNVGNRGLFDETLNKWIMYRSLAGNDHLGGGKWYVDDPYNTSTNFKLGDPQRLMSSGSYTAGTSDTMGPYVTLTAGKWLVTGNWIFNNTSSSSKRLTVGFYRSTTNQAYTYRVHTTASSSSAHRLEVVDTITIDAASERLTLYASSSPASTSAATQYIVAIRLT